MTLKKKLYLLLLFIPFFSQGSVVQRVYIKGNHLIEKSLIKKHIRLKPKRRYRLATVKKDVRRLFSLGFFEDIQVKTFFPAKGKVNVTYTVKEKPIVHSIQFKGNKEMDEEDLKELLKLKEFDFLNFDQLGETLSSIKESYKEKGYSMAEVSYKLVPLKESSKVRLMIHINENQKILIKKINFIGQRHFSDSFFKRRMMTKEANLLSFFSAFGTYNPTLFERDLQMINYFYRDKGYLQIHLEKPELSITPDQKEIYINIKIKEGPRFKMGEVEFKGDDLFSKEDVVDNLTLPESPYFSLSSLQRDVEWLARLYKDKGYAFVQVDPRIFPDNLEEDKIHILMEVKRGQRYTVGRIDIAGNHKTRDKVILRQFLLKEDELYNETEKQMSQNLIQRLGFFDAVDLKLKKTKKDNRVDILVDLKEREKLGEAHLAGGYNSFSKLFVKGGIKNSNFLGLGHAISVQLDLSRFQELFNFNYTNPYLLDQDWSFSLDVFNVGRDMTAGYSDFGFSSSERLISYSQLNTGFSFSFGHHFSRYFSVFLKYNLKNQSLSHESVYLIRNLPVIKNVFEFLYGDLKSNEVNELRSKYWVTFKDIYPLSEGEGLNSSISGIFEYDKRNDRLRPSEGYYGSLSLEYSGLGGDFDYTKMYGVVRYYKKLFWKVVLKNNFNLATVFSNDPKKNPPFTELFLLGGAESLRGFKYNTVGDRRYSKEAFEYAVKNNYENPVAFAWRPYGGSSMFFYNLELQFPLVKNQNQWEGVLFFDIGEASKKLTLSFKDRLRMDVGVGLKWWSPFGPIRIDFGFPFQPKKEYGEEFMEFQFSMGSSF